MNLSAVLKHSSLLGHWLRCVLSPSKHFVAGGLQPIQTIILTDRQPSGKERRNSHDIAQQILSAQGLKVFCLICCPSCWSALLSRISQKERKKPFRLKTWASLLHLIQPEKTWNCQWMPSMMNIKLCKLSGVWLRQETWKLAKVF